MINIYSSIQTPLKRYVLFRGTLFAGLGALLLLFAGVWVPREQLAYWGGAIIGVAFLLITLGLLPYRRLCRLETKPNELILTKKVAVYSEKNKKIFTIPRESIGRVAYCLKGHHYGMGIWLKKPLPEKVVIHRRGGKMPYNQALACKRYGCDLFLPYFSERSINSLEL